MWHGPWLDVDIGGCRQKVSRIVTLSYRPLTPGMIGDPTLALLPL